MTAIPRKGSHLRVCRICAGPVPRAAEKLTSVALPGVRQSDQIKLAAVVNTMAQMEHQKRGRHR